MPPLPLEPLEPGEVQQLQQILNETLEAAEARLVVVSPSDYLHLPFTITDVSAFTDQYSTLEGLVPDELFRTSLHRLDDVLERLRQRVEAEPAAVRLVRPSTHRTEAGRQKVDISRELLEELEADGMGVEAQAEQLGVHPSTIKRRRKEFELQKGYTTAVPEEVDAIVQEVRADGYQNVGEVMFLGALRARGHCLPRRLVRDALRRVDRIGRMQRWLRAIKRRRYSVPFPNSLWHIDGHHKLIKYGFVTHGAIDGKTRCVVFLRAATNNEAATVRECFLDATEKWGWPSRVRTDHGGENAQVKALMEYVRGLGRGKETSVVARLLCSCIQGRSVHNQRIERLWKDVNRVTIELFKQLFEELEAEEKLDPTNSIHLWLLQLIFLPLINLALDGFIEAWNSHRMGNEKYTPRGLFRKGVAAAERAGFRMGASPFADGASADDAAVGAIDFADYGRAYGGERRREEENGPHVRLPSRPCPFSEQVVEALVAYIGAWPEKVNLAWGKQAYSDALQVVRDWEL